MIKISVQPQIVWGRRRNIMDNIEQLHEVSIIRVSSKTLLKHSKYTEIGPVSFMMDGDITIAWTSSIKSSEMRGKILAPFVMGQGFMSMKRELSMVLILKHKKKIVSVLSDDLLQFQLGRSGFLSSNGTKIFRRNSK